LAGLSPFLPKIHPFPLSQKHQPAFRISPSHLAQTMPWPEQGHSKRVVVIIRRFLPATLANCEAPGWFLHKIPSFSLNHPRRANHFRAAKSIKGQRGALSIRLHSCALFQA
jgi:hypothetical protein